MGAILSVFTIVIVLLYSAYKCIALFSIADFKVQTLEQVNNYSETDVFGANDEFVVAGAVTSWDGSSEDITDLSIGQVKFYLKSWSRKDEDHLNNE